MFWIIHFKTIIWHICLTIIVSTSQSKESGSIWDTYFTEKKGRFNRNLIQRVYLNSVEPPLMYIPWYKGQSFVQTDLQCVHTLLNTDASILYTMDDSYGVGIER